MKKICRPTMTSAAASTARRSSESWPKPRSIQMTTIVDRHREADERVTPAEHEAVLEPEARAHAVEPRVLLAHEVRAVGVRAQPERDDLDADDHQQRAGDHRVQVPLAAEDVDLQQRDGGDQRAERRA